MDVECLFSLSGKTVSFLRTHLNDESIHSTVVLNSWMMLPMLSVQREFEDHLVWGWKRGANRVAHESIKAKS